MNFIIISAVSVGAITLTCLFIYECLRIIWAVLPRMTIAPRLRILVMIVPIYCMHIANIWFYAALFFMVENGTSLGKIIHQSSIFHRDGPGWTYDTFLDCLYFSASTYTSLGFGDFLPTGDLRMLAAAEVLDGLIMIGWTISFTYLAMEKFWKAHEVTQRLRS